MFKAKITQNIPNNDKRLEMTLPHLQVLIVLRHLYCLLQRFYTIVKSTCKTHIFNYPCMVAADQSRPDNAIYKLNLDTIEIYPH